METLKCIETRRSIRQFLKKEVSDQTIKQILNLAILSPSSMDSKPWHFIIVKEDSLRKRIGHIKEDNAEIIISAESTSLKLNPKYN